MIVVLPFCRTWHTVAALNFVAAVAVAAYAVVPVLAAADESGVSKEEVRRFEGHERSVNRLSLSPDGRYLITASSDRMCYVLAIDTFQQLRTYGPHRGELTGAVMLKDKSVVVATLQSDVIANGPIKNTLVQWDWDSEEIRRKFPEADQPYWNLQVAANESKLAVSLGRNSGKIRLYNFVNNDRQGLDGPAGGTLATRAIAFSPDSQIVRMGTGGGSVRWTLVPIGPGGKINEDGRAITTALYYLPDGKQFVAGHTDGALYLFDDVEGSLAATFKPHAAEVTSLAVNKEGDLFASTAADGTLRIYSLKTRALLKEWTAHQGSANSVVFLKSREVATGGTDGVIRVWSLDGKPMFTVGATPVPKLAQAPDQAQVSAAVTLLKQVFKEDYAAAKKLAEKVKLAEKLLGQSKDEKPGSAERYAIYVEALRLAIEGASTTVALKAGDEFTGAFVPPAEFRSNLANRLLANIQTPKDHSDLATATLAWSEESRRKQAFAEASQYVQLANRAAQKARNPALLQTVQEAGDRIRQQQKQVEAFQQAEQVLKATPDDPAANQAAGLYHAIVAGDWTRAVPHLAKGTGPIQAAAASELSLGKKPDQALAIAEAWQAAADSAEADHRPHLYASAVYWYTKALPGLAGLQKIKVDQAIKKIAPAGIQRK